MKYLFVIIITIIFLVGCKPLESLSSHRYCNLKRALKKSEHVLILDLGSKNLDSIPETIGDLENLKVLILGDNNISYLPSTIGKLHKLETLNLMFNPIDKLPKEMENLKNLKKLVLHGTNISEEEIVPLREKLPDCLIAGYSSF